MLILYSSFGDVTLYFIDSALAYFYNEEKVQFL